MKTFVLSIVNGLLLVLTVTLSSCGQNVSNNSELAKQDIRNQLPNCKNIIQARDGGISGFIIDYYVASDSNGNLYLFRDEFGSEKMVKITEHFKSASWGAFITDLFLVTFRFCKF